MRGMRACMKARILVLLSSGEVVWSCPSTMQQQRHEASAIRGCCVSTCCNRLGEPLEAALRNTQLITHQQFSMLSVCDCSWTVREV